MTTDLDRLLELAGRATGDFWRSGAASPPDADFQAACNPQTIIGLIERVKESERELKIATTKLEKTESKLKEAESALNVAASDAVRFQSRLRAAEEVVEAANIVVLDEGLTDSIWDRLRKALRRYDQEREKS